MATTVEGKLQSEIIKWLKSKGAYVVKARPGRASRRLSQISYFYTRERGVLLKCKRSSKAPYRVGQEATLARLSEWSPFVYTAHPENWPQIKTELTTLFF
jgi:hypothetical protein